MADPWVARKGEPLHSFTIAGARAGDLSAITRIWHEGWADGHVGHVPEELARHRTEEQFAARAERNLDRTLVASAGGMVLGFVVVVGDEVEQIYVDRAARGSGVATTLLKAAEDRIRKHGHERAWLAVVAGNQKARAFYARHGWRDTGPISYPAETEGSPFMVPAHRYEIDLTT